MIKVLAEMTEEKIPFIPCKIPEACFIDPVIMKELEAVTDDLGLETPRYETSVSRRQNRDYFSTVFYVGEDEFQGMFEIIDKSSMMTFVFSV